MDCISALKRALAVLHLLALQKKLRPLMRKKSSIIFLNKFEGMFESKKIL